MPQPAPRMPTLRVVMGPVNDAALRVGLKFAVEGNGISLANRVNPRREVDVVSYKQRAAAGKFENESLVPAALVVIGKNADDGARALDLATINQCAGRPCPRRRRCLGRRHRRFRERLLGRAI